jgi:hypothetical protein
MDARSNVAIEAAIKQLQSDVKQLTEMIMELGEESVKDLVSTLRAVTDLRKRVTRLEEGGGAWAKDEGGTPPSLEDYLNMLLGTAKG